MMSEYSVLYIRCISRLERSKGGAQDGAGVGYIQLQALGKLTEKAIGFDHTRHTQPRRHVRPRCAREGLSHGVRISTSVGPCGGQ